MDDLKHGNISVPGHDKRKHRRYRLSVPLELSTTDGPVIRGLTIEVSEGGFSAALSAPLEVGDQVVATPIGYDAMPAVVRWIRGRAYGFEFLDLSIEQQNRIRNDCRRLPPYRSSLDF
jgi:PilZ domain